MAQKRVKIRIAVAVDHLGNWGCAGASGMPAREALELAADDVQTGYYRIYWLNAEVEVPQPIEVHIDLPNEAITNAPK